MNELKIKNLNNNTIKFYKKCFDDNGGKKNIENIEWQFLINNDSIPFVDIAYDEEKDKTAAIFAASVIKFKIGNKVLDGTQTLDTITDINYRGKGLFIKFAKDVYSKINDSKAALTYGFPNGKSIHGYRTKLEWEVLDPVPFLIKPLKSKYFTNKIKFLKFLPNINLSFSKQNKYSNYNLVEKDYFPDQVDKIWQIFSEVINVSAIRNKEYLEWRYLKKPNEDYKIVHCFDKNDIYLGFVIYTVKIKHGGVIAYIMELIYDKNKPIVGETLLNYAVDEIKKSNADCILSWCFDHSPNYKVFKNSYFYKMPDKFKPIELHFGARAFKESLKTIIYNRKNWYLSYSDSDTV